MGLVESKQEVSKIEHLEDNIVLNLPCQLYKVVYNK